MTTIKLQEPTPGFFSAVAFWVMDEDLKGLVYYEALTWYRWALVDYVQDYPTPAPYAPELTPNGPKCLLLYEGTEVKVRADAATVAAAWQRHHAKAAAPAVFTKIGNN